MTALSDLNAWRAEQVAKGCRVGVAEEILWLCGRINELRSEIDQLRDQVDGLS